MIPFPGESISVDSYTNIVGTPIGSLSDIQIRAGVSSFSPGATALVRVFFALHYLESADTPGDVSWAVEVSAGVGSLTLTECLGDGTPDVPLGTFDVAGGDTLVVPSTSITVADVYTDLYGSLLVECTTGFVDVQQIKLRVFPVGGPLGGWGDVLHPAWERTTDAVTQTVRRQDGADTGGIASRSWNNPAGPTNIAPAWINTVGLMPDARTGSPVLPIIVSLDGAVDPTSVGRSDVTLTARSIASPPPGESGGTATLVGTGILASRTPYKADINPAEGLVDGVDYITSPYEVQESVGLAQADTAPDNTWVTVYDVAGVPTALGDIIHTEDEAGDADTVGPFGFPLIGAQPWEPSIEAGTGTITQVWPDQAAVPPHDLTLPDVDQVLIVPSHPWFRRDSAPTTPGVTTDGAYTVTRKNGFLWNFTIPLAYTTAMPPYRVWDINAVKRRPLRQLHRDDGQGGTPPRAFGGASRIRTGRAYGYD